ncbi:hypothetical protein BKA82DRAFT_4018919 [Pisolithus tinctorius]|nr:hypothetical protein BKA82DRAFT_4018919 [Pisolithus tinctorius]
MSNGTVSATASSYSKHSEFYTHTITFLVEDSLFRISREPLEAESAVFRDMFLLPQGESETVEGQSDTCAVILQGISKKEFESLLRALMYRKHGTNRGSDLDRGPMDLGPQVVYDVGPVDPIDKVVLALQYNVREWLLPAFLALAK